MHKYPTILCTLDTLVIWLELPWGCSVALFLFVCLFPTFLWYPGVDGKITSVHVVLYTLPFPVFQCCWLGVFLIT